MLDEKRITYQEAGISNEEIHYFIKENIDLALNGRDPRDLTDLVSIIQMINADLFSTYLVDKRIGNDNIWEQRLHAQVYADIVLRGLYDFIEVSI